MKPLILTLILAMLPLTRAHSQTLASYVDRNRVLLLFAPTDHDPRLREQLKLLDHHRPDMRERDLILIPILSQSGPPTTANTLRSLNPLLISDEEQLVIRNRFHVAPTDFAAILLGKDGGEKLRSTQPLAVSRINQTIDAMPMRQDELRQRTPK